MRKLSIFEFIFNTEVSTVFLVIALLNNKCLKRVLKKRKTRTKTPQKGSSWEKNR